MASRSRTKAVPRATSNASAKKHAILMAVLPQVAFDGWTDEAYRRGLKRAGVSEGEAGLLFPQDIRDVIDLFGTWADEQMLARIAAEPGFARQKVREKITFGVRARLEALTPHREAMRRLLYWYALPTHLPLGARRLYQTVDLIWREAGDASTDFNFYTKRGLLAAVIKATVLFWLDDNSAQCRDTWSFLDRRIAEVLRVGKSISLIKEWSPSELLEMVRGRLKRA